MKNMRTTSMFLLALVLVAPAAHALTGLAFGVKAGLSLAKLDYDLEQAEDWDTKTGFAAGGYLSLGLAPGLTLQPHVLYAQRGGQDDQTATDESGNPLGTFTFKFKIDYLEIPVLLRYELPVAGKVRPTLLAGPALALRLSSKMSMPDDEVLQDVGDTEADVDWIKDTDAAMMLGAGVAVDLGGRTLTVEGLYGLGLTDINDSDGLAEIKNRSISVLAGITF